MLTAMNLVGCFKWGCGGLVAFAFLAWIVLMFLADVIPSRNQSAGSAQRTILSTGWVGCREASEYERLVSIQAQGDQAAFAQYLQSSSCRILSKGSPFYPQSTRGGLAEIRLVGDSLPLWTAVEALSR